LGLAVRPARKTRTLGGNFRASVSAAAVPITHHAIAAIPVEFEVRQSTMSMKGTPRGTRAKMGFITAITAALRRFGTKLGPYLMIELLLPGGTLVALALFLIRNWSQVRQLPTD
jgi:hypothetical protein